MKVFISLEEAISILDSNVNNIGLEEISILDGIGRTLGEDAFSMIDNPPFNKSAMDGYAIKGGDSTKKLKIIDKVFAGSVSKEIVKKGTAIRIMTGAPIPEGADAVIKQEDVIERTGSIVLKKKVKEDENICFKGEDISSGQILVQKGNILNYSYIELLASAGIKRVKVYKKPRVAFISTGDEVVDIEYNLGPGKIYNSNKYSIIGRLKELGYEVSYISHINDSISEIGEEIKSASREAKLILTTGGASVGEKDFVREVIDYIDGEKLFWKVKMKPGSSVLAGKYKDVIILCLSGNPTAALTSFELLGKPTLEKLEGKETINIEREKAILMDDFLRKSPNRRFLRGFYLQTFQGQRVYITQKKSGNGILSSTINSNCIIEIPAGNQGIFKGNIIDIIKL